MDAQHKSKSVCLSSIAPMASLEAFDEVELEVVEYNEMKLSNSVQHLVYLG